MTRPLTKPVGLIVSLLLTALAFGPAQAGDKAKGDIPITTSSANAKVLFLKGQAALDRGDFIDANALFLEAAALDEGFAYAWLNAANSSFSPEAFNKRAKKAHKKAASASDGERLLTEIAVSFANNDADQRLKASQKLIEAYPESKRAWIARGTVLGGLNRNEEARAAFRRAAELGGDWAVPYTALGFSYLFNQPKDFERAEDNMAKAIAIDPDNDNAWINLGDVHRAQQALAKARDDYGKAAELDARNGLAFIKRAHVNSFLGAYDEARADYDRSVALARQQNKANYANYRAFTHVHEGKPDAAVAELETLNAAIGEMDMPDQQRNSAQVFTLTNQATIALHHGMVDVADRAIQRVAANLRDSAAQVDNPAYARNQEATIAYWQGLLAARSGDYDTALAMARKNADLLAPDANPRKMEPYHDLMGLVALLRNDNEQAIAHYEQANPGNMYSRYHLGLAHEAAGHAQEARDIFKQVGEWNFNSVGYALVRKDALQRIAS